MGVFSGSLTYKLFHVQEEIPEDWRSQFREQLLLHKFEPLQPDDEHEESIGWVQLDRPLEPDFELENIVWDHYVILGLRRDRYSIPNALLKAHVADAEREYKRRNDKDKLGKYEREDIEHMVKRELKENSLPKMRVVDVCWNLRNNRVRLWTHANKLGEIFQGLFVDTFGLPVVAGNPYTNGVELGLKPEQQQALQEVEPTNFLDPALGVAESV